MCRPYSIYENIPYTNLKIPFTTHRECMKNAFPYFRNSQLFLTIQRNYQRFANYYKLINLVLIVRARYAN